VKGEDGDLRHKQEQEYSGYLEKPFDVDQVSELSQAQAIAIAAARPSTAPDTSRGLRTCNSMSDVSMPSRLIVNTVKRKTPRYAAN